MVIEVLGLEGLIMRLGSESCYWHLRSCNGSTKWVQGNLLVGDW